MLSFRSERSRRVLATISAASIALFSGAAAAGAVTNFNLVVSGSTTVCPIANDILASYQSLYTDTTIVTHDGGPAGVDCPGSGAGISNLLNGNADVADASRPVQSSDTGTTFNNTQVDQWVIGLDGISIIANSATVPADITSLTVTQIKNIYNCTDTNWNQLGSATSATITVETRSPASGTYGDFNKFIGITAPGTCAHVPSQGDSNPGMLAATQASPNALAYVGLGFAYTNGAVSPNVRIIPVDGTTPTAATVVAAVQALTSPNPFSQSPAPDNVPVGEYAFGRQLFMDTIKPSALPATGTRSTNYARAIDWVNGAIVSAGQTQVLNEGSVGLTTQNPTSDPTFNNACQTVSNGHYCPQIIPPWNVTVTGVTNVNDVVAIGLNWQAQAPTGDVGGWIRSDVTSSGVVNVNQVVKIGLHWQEAWTRWVD